MSPLLSTFLLVVSVAATIVVAIVTLYFKITFPLTLDELLECLPAGEISVIDDFSGVAHYILTDRLDERSHHVSTGRFESIFIKADLHRGGVEAHFRNGRLMIWKMNGVMAFQKNTCFREQRILETMLVRIQIAIHQEKQSCSLSVGA